MASGPHGGGSGGCAGSAVGVQVGVASWSSAVAIGPCWSSGVGSVQRSRKVRSRAPTTGPRSASCTSCQGGFGPYALAMAIACGSPWCSASSRRLWHRSIPPTKAMSSSGRPGWRSTTSFWWCEPPRRTRWSSSTSPPAASMSSPRLRFSSSLYASLSRWDRQSSPLTITPRLAAAANSSATVGPSSRSRSSGSPRQSVKNRWSPARRLSTSVDQPVKIRYYRE